MKGICGRRMLPLYRCRSQSKSADSFTTLFLDSLPALSILADGRDDDFDKLFVKSLLVLRYLLKNLVYRDCLIVRTNLTHWGFFSGYANVSQYASDFKYRAWGALTSLNYGNSVPVSLSYNNRLQVSNYELTCTSTLVPSPSMDIDYSYSADGRLRLSTDKSDATLDGALDMQTKLDGAADSINATNGS